MTDLVEQLTHMLHTVGALSPALAHLNRPYIDTLAAWETARRKRQWYASLFQDAPMSLLVTNQGKPCHTSFTLVGGSHDFTL